MNHKIKQKLVYSGLLTASVLTAFLTFQFGGVARSYLDASPESLEGDRPVAKNFDEVLDTLKKGKRVEIRHTVGHKTTVKVVEGSLPINDKERSYLRNLMKRRAERRRRDYEQYVTQLVTKETVTLADMEREAMMSHGALRAEHEYKLFEQGDFLIIDDAVAKPPVPEGWNMTRYNRLYRIDGQWRAMVTMYDPKTTPRLENEYRRYTNLADSQLDEWARNFNQKTIKERKTIILEQRELSERILALAGKDKNQPEIKKEWISLWHQRTPLGIRFDEASWYAMLQQ